MRIGTTYLREKYRVIEVDNENVMEIMDNMQVKMNREAKELMDAPITMEDIEKAVKMGKSNKAPGIDGINSDFLKIMWQTIKQDIHSIMSEMFMNGTITDDQKKGILVCIQKRSDPRSMQDYRTLTLLNADYKLLTRLIANRIHQWITTALYQN